MTESSSNLNSASSRRKRDLFAAMSGVALTVSIAALIGMRGKPRPSDLVAQQPLGEADELGRGRIARTPSASFVG